MNSLLIQLGSTTRNAVMVWLIVGMVCMSGMTDMATAEEIVDAGRRALEQRGFPWYDPDRQTITRVEERDPGRAASLNRDLIPPAAPRENKLPTPATNRGQSYPMMTAAAWILIALLFFLIVFISVRQFLKIESNRNRKSGEADFDPQSVLERITQLPFDVRQASSADFREQAALAASRGAFGPATMLLFSHILLQLDRRGLIRLRKGKTNRQYLQELDSHQPLASYYRQVMVAFEDYFFGNHVIDRQVYENCWNQLDSFQQGLDRLEN